MTYQAPKPKGPFTLWRYLGCEGWAFDDYPTLKDALEGERYGAAEWVVAKAVNYVVTEAEEGGPQFPATIWDDPELMREYTGT